MKLRCTGNYRNDPKGLVYRKGQTFDATAEDAAFLLADSPGSFKEVKQKRVSKPPVDKMVKRPGKEK